MRFWKLEEKTWKPGSKDVDLTKLEVWKDPGYGFSIEKPAKEWFFDRSEKAYRFMLKIQIPEAGVQVQIYLMAYENTTGVTAAQKADEYMEGYRKQWRDIRKDSIVEDDKYRVGKEKGFMHTFAGIDSYGNIARLKNIFVTMGGTMFVLGSWQRSGVSQELIDQLEKALASFKLYE
jgi:hypothetical protein